tara:strand:- start:3405 stop:4583 length:1179 start_codon:yes stop_codon:yes gene_type:complete
VTKQLKVDNIVNVAGTGKPNFPVSPTSGGAALSTLNTYSYTSSATEPSSPKNGAIWWDSANSKVYVYANGEFKEVTLNTDYPSAYSSGNPWSGGRAIWAGGDTGSYDNTIQYSAIQTTGNTVDFGDLTVARDWASMGSNSSRGLILGGNANNTIDYVTIGTTGNATDFGDLLTALYNHSSCSDGTKAFTFGGTLTGVSPTYTDQIQQTVIATTGNATDFGDTTVSSRYNSCCSDATRAVVAIGESTNNTYQNIMEYITTASAGNATDFGDISTNRGQMGSTNDATRGLFAGGWGGNSNTGGDGGSTPGSRYNRIEYITIQTAGNVTDFGDLNNLNIRMGCCADTTRALFGGGYDGSSRINVIDYVTVQTTGNATDYGDLLAQTYETGACSGD